MTSNRPSLHTILSPALLHLYDVTDSIVVIIDVLRATSTITTALYNGAASVIPVDTVSGAIQLGQTLPDSITAGERDGRVAEGLAHGNSPFEYPTDFVRGRTLVLTTTNGTKLLHMALEKGAGEIITGSFPNFSAVCTHLLASNKNVLLGCAAWKDRVNLEDTLFAGAVIDRIGKAFTMNCDSSHMAHSLYRLAKDDLFGYMRDQDASHYHRLMNYGLEKDIRYCLTPDGANILPVFDGLRLVNKLP